MVNLKLTELSGTNRATILVSDGETEFKDRYRTWINDSGKYIDLVNAIASNGVNLCRV